MGRIELLLILFGLPAVFSIYAILNYRFIKDITARKHLEEELERHVRLTTLRADIGGALSRNQDLRHILQECSELLVNYLDVAFFRIWTLNNAEQVLEMQASAGMYTHLNGPHGRVRVGTFEIGQIARDRRRHLSNDLLNEPFVDKEWAAREGMIAYAGYPLMVADRLVGVMVSFARTALAKEIFVELGYVGGIIALCIERKRAVEEVIFKNIVLSTLKECTIDGIMVVDDNAAIILYNRRLAEMWGIPSDLVEAGDDTPLLQFVANKQVDTEGFLARIGYLYQHKEEKSREELALKDGRVFDRFSAPMEGVDGKYYGRVWNFRDITEQKRHSEEVNRVRNLESIGLLAGGLAHDFNNVLSIICGNISYIKMLAAKDSAIIEPLTDAEEACVHARKFGIQLQAMSQASAPAKEPVELYDVIEAVAGTLFKGSAIAYSIVAAEDTQPIEADPRQIRQVFEILLTNAIESMTNGGKAEIAIDNYAAGGEDGLLPGSGRFVRVTIQDNGKGIPEEHLAKIFDPYFSTKDIYSQRGMGLGLSICHAILKKHNGHIFVESKAGAGTGVSVYLPASGQETESLPERRSSND